MLAFPYRFHQLRVFTAVSGRGTSPAPPILHVGHGGARFPPGNPGGVAGVDGGVGILILQMGVMWLRTGDGPRSQR